ncbi:MAG: hypothetical protein GY869_22475, partial [Planctomycetes bacterium]|nr:hypothetical protein [Planctomycetota bacterium]
MKRFLVQPFLVSLIASTLFIAGCPIFNGDPIHPPQVKQNSSFTVAVNIVDDGTDGVAQPDEQSYGGFCLMLPLGWTVNDASPIPYNFNDSPGGTLSASSNVASNCQYAFGAYSEYQWLGFITSNFHLPPDIDGSDTWDAEFEIDVDDSVQGAVPLAYQVHSTDAGGGAFSLPVTLEVDDLFVIIDEDAGVDAGFDAGTDGDTDTD